VEDEGRGRGMDQKSHFGPAPRFAEDGTGTTNQDSLRIDSVQIYRRRVGVVWPSRKKCSNAKIVFGILSHRLANRTLVRETWGQHRCVWFMVGKIGGKWPSVEHAQHGDLILVDLEEHYGGWNSSLPFKTAVFFLFARKSFPELEYAVKADEDTYVQVDNLYELLRRKSPEYMGAIKKNATVIRDPADKWFVPREMFLSDHFPTYMQGAGYVLAASTLDCYETIVANANFINMEDVATGIIMKQCGVLPQNTDKVDTGYRGIFAPRISRKPFLIHKVELQTHHLLQHTDEIVHVHLRGNLGDHLFQLASAQGVAMAKFASCCYTGHFLGEGLVQIRAVPRCDGQMKSDKTNTDEGLLFFNSFLQVFNSFSPGF